MGYTHYWTVNTKGNRTNYIKAILAMQKIAKAHKDMLSGYSAHTKLGQYGGIKINGKRDDGHGDFIFREHIAMNESFNFCKTAHKPYDIVVTACLAAAKYYMGDDIKVSSDGYACDWIAGVKLANKVLRRKTITNPIAKKEEISTNELGEQYVNI